MKSPIRWGADDSDATSELRETIRHAQQCTPSSDRVAALAAAVLAELQLPPLSASPKGMAGKGALSVGSAKVAAICMGAALSIGVGWKAWHVSGPEMQKRAVEAVQPGVVSTPALQEPRAVSGVLDSLHTSPAPTAVSSGLPQKQERAVKSRLRAKSADGAEDFSLLHDARSLRRSNPAAALRSLDEHARRYPKSAVREERDALRIEIMKQVDPTAAQVLQARFERDFPGSVYRRNVVRER